MRHALSSQIFVERVQNDKCHVVSKYTRGLVQFNGVFIMFLSFIQWKDTMTVFPQHKSILKDDSTLKDVVNYF